MRWLAWVCVLWVQTAAADEVYRWLDMTSVVNYSDQMPQGKVKGLITEHKITPNVIDAQPSYVLNYAAQHHPVILYSGDCGPLCESARSLLEKRGVPYALKNPLTNKPDADELNKMTGELRVPVLKVGNQVYKGFQQERWAAALDQADYPKFITPGERMKSRAAKSAVQPTAKPTAKPAVQPTVQPEASVIQPNNSVDKGQQ